MDTEIISANDPHALERARALLEASEPVAFPTDTVYGVGVLAMDSQAIEKLFAVKDREQTKAIAVLVSQVEQLKQVTADMPPAALRLAQRFWPGPLTLVVSRHARLPANLSPQPTIGVRMPDHPVARALIDLTGPLAVTSANISGGPSTLTAQEVQAQLGGRIPLVVDGGRTPGGTPSTVVDCTGPELSILRPGPISWEDVQRV